MKKRRLSKDKKMRLIIAISLVVLVGFFTLVLPQLYDGKNSKSVEASPVECVLNSDCIIIRGSCCSCEDGGAPQCVPKNQLGEYTKKLESCLSQGSCFNLDCGKITCGCVDDVCVGRPA
jgi:hypothetical protein